MGIPDSFSPSVAASTPFSPPFPSSAQGQWVGLRQALMYRGFGCALRVSGQRQPHQVCASARKSLCSPVVSDGISPILGCSGGSCTQQGQEVGESRPAAASCQPSRGISAAPPHRPLCLPSRLPFRKNGLEARNFSKQREKSTPRQLLPTFRSVDSRGGDQREMGV